jgi:hypothetical protein
MTWQVSRQTPRNSHDQIAELDAHNSRDSFAAIEIKLGAGRGIRTYAAFTTGPTMGIPGSTPDPLHLTFQGVKAGTYLPGNGCPDGIHYDVKGNLWAATARLGGIIEIDPRGLILGFVPVPNGDLATTNFASAALTTGISFWRGPSAAPSGVSRRPIPA